MVAGFHNGRSRPRVALACWGLVLAGCSHAATARAQAVPHDATAVTPSRQKVLDAVSAPSMRGHLSFLASDLLEGRDTPSRGLDLAAEYIAAQFRRAGLEPAGTQDFFQIANWNLIEPDPATLELDLSFGGATHRVPIERLRLSATGPLDLSGIGLVRAASTAPEDVSAIKAETARGKAVIVFAAPPTGEATNSQAAQRAARGALNALISQAAEAEAAAVLVVERTEPVAGTGLPRGRLVDPENPSPRIDLNLRRLPVATLYDPALAEKLSAPGALDNATVALKLGPPAARPVVLKNVVGLLRGSDPALQNEYILVSAHYDHLGVNTAGPPGTDRIYNGANDDASGTTMVIELASALARSEPRPKRSILFVAVFGEEKGLLGSRYYGRHPLVPLEKTVAMVNLEQVGRTDDSEGPNVNRAAMTGFDFSEVGTILHQAGQAVGIEVFKHPRNSDAFFGRSDNQAMADHGIPSHTLCTAFLFPEYHQLGDHWDKVDYDNMARVAKAVALGLMELGDRAEPPRWDESNPKTAQYVKAWRALHPEAPAPASTPIPAAGTARP